MLSVGIDWADDHHDVVLVDTKSTDACSMLDRFRIAHSCEGFASLHAKVRAHETDPSQVLVAIETPHGLLVHDLVRHGFCVYAINPKSVNRYKDRHSPASLKDDGRDAMALAHILRTDRQHYRPLEMLPENYRLMDELCQDLRQLVDDRSRIVNRLTSCLKDYYPQALGLFSRLDAQISMVFLRNYPDPADLKSLTKKQFLAFLKKHRYPCPDRVDALCAAVTAQAPMADPVIARAGRMRMLALLDQLVALQRHVQDYEHQIQELFDQLPESDRISSLPGVGDRIGPELVATLGPRPQTPRPQTPRPQTPRPKETAEKPEDDTDLQPGQELDRKSHRFDTPQALEKLAGAAPVTRQSGNWKNVHYRRACDKRLRRTLHDWAGCSLRTCRWARAFYDHHKQQGHRHSTILRNLACKLIAILYQIWRTGEEYDEQRHIENLKKHNVVWATQL
jgi:transposase